MNDAQRRELDRRARARTTSAVDPGALFTLTADGEAFVAPQLFDEPAPADELEVPPPFEPTPYLEPARFCSVHPCPGPALTGGRCREHCDGAQGHPAATCQPCALAAERALVDELFPEVTA